MNDFAPSFPSCLRGKKGAIGANYLSSYQKRLMRGSPAAYQWQYDKADLKYCPRCGAPFTLEDVDIPGQPQLVCHACKFVFYLDPKLAVLAIVTFGSRILLLKRAKEPGKGKWALLAGFVERGEDPFLALKREAQEETGLEIRVERVLKVKAFPDAGMVLLRLSFPTVFTE